MPQRLGGEVMEASFNALAAILIGKAAQACDKFDHRSHHAPETARKHDALTARGPEHCEIHVLWGFRIEISNEGK